MPNLSSRITTLAIAVRNFRKQMSKRYIFSTALYILSKLNPWKKKNITSTYLHILFHFCGTQVNKLTIVEREKILQNKTKRLIAINQINKSLILRTIKDTSSFLIQQNHCMVSQKKSDAPAFKNMLPSLNFFLILKLTDMTR